MQVHVGEKRGIAVDMFWAKGWMGLSWQATLAECPFVGVEGLEALAKGISSVAQAGVLPSKGSLQRPLCLVRWRPPSLWCSFARRGSWISLPGLRLCQWTECLGETWQLQRWRFSSWQIVGPSLPNCQNCRPGNSKLLLYAAC